MENLIKAGRLFFAIMIVGLAGQQFYDGYFRPVLIPTYATHFPGEIVLVYLLSVLLIVAAVGIVLNRQGRMLALGLAGLFGGLFIFCHLPYELWIDPRGGSIGSWGNALKESAMAGGALIVAGSYRGGFGYGRIFFAVTMIIFGIEHFIYAQFVQTLVPDWIPGHLFWTYFAGVALIAAGVGFILRIQLRLAGLLLGGAIFIWFVVLHIPRAAVAPATDNGNELASVF
ncbi:MAG TPA: hypothetical protein VGS79_11260, partial [Puia sp.]|nr:hypothetical protein [Puia sp.]